MKPGVTRLILGAATMALTALPANAAGGKIRIMNYPPHQTLYGRGFAC